MVMGLVLTALAVVLLSFLVKKLVSALEVARKEVLKEKNTVVMVGEKKLESGGGRRSGRRVTFVGVEEREVDRFEAENEEEDLQDEVEGGYGAEAAQLVEGEGFKSGAEDAEVVGVSGVAEDCRQLQEIWAEQVDLGMQYVIQLEDVGVEETEEVGGIKDDNLVSDEKIEGLESGQDGGISGVEEVEDEEVEDEEVNKVGQIDETVGEVDSDNASCDQLNEVGDSAQGEQIDGRKEEESRELEVECVVKSDGNAEEKKDEMDGGRLDDEADELEIKHTQVEKAEGDEGEQIKELEDPQNKLEDNNSNEKLGSSYEDDWEGIERSQLENDFAVATAFFHGEDKDGKLLSVGSDVKMQLHGLQKIVMEGPCREPQPMALKMSARAKWNAWQRLGNMNPEEAMEQYIAIVSDKIPGWGGQDSAAEEQLEGLEAMKPSTPDPGLGAPLPSEPPIDSQRMEDPIYEAERDGSVGSSNIKAKDNK